MKNKTKRVFWGFFSLDYKAMGEYLEEMAEKCECQIIFYDF